MKTSIKKKLSRAKLKQGVKQQQKLINCFEAVFKYIFENEVPDNIALGVNKITLHMLGIELLDLKDKGLIIKPGSKEW